MQTAVHIAGIIAQARGVLAGAEFIGSEFYRKERAAYLFFKAANKKKFALALLFHPQAHGLMFLPAGKINVTTGEKPFPFFQQLYGATLTTIEQIDFDRLARVSLKQGSDINHIILEALGPHGNAWLLDGDYGKQAVLRNRDFETGDHYEIPGAGERLDPRTMTLDQLQQALDDSGRDYLLDALTRVVNGLDVTLAKEAMFRANISTDVTIDIVTQSELQSIIDSVQSLIELSVQNPSGYLYEIKGISIAQPFKLKWVESEPEKFADYSLAVLAATQTRKMQGEVEDENKRLGQTLDTSIKRQERSIENIAHDLDTARDFERLRELADILKANLHSLKRGMTEVTLPDLYGENDVTISLDPKLDGAENADAYYKKFQKGREALSTLERRLVIAQEELERLQKLSTRFEDDPESAKQQYMDDIAALSSQRDQTTSAVGTPRLPYRIYTTTTGLQVFVGRDGSDNDETTFKHIKPYELWFHAAQCPGSHVGLKYPNKSFTPSKDEIAEAAALAAWFSKARNSAVVPVNYTERKYVRKPRKAKSGLVTIEREKTVMVTPKEPAKPQNQALSNSE